MNVNVSINCEWLQRDRVMDPNTTAARDRETSISAANPFKGSIIPEDLKDTLFL